MQLRPSLSVAIAVALLAAPVAAQPTQRAATTIVEVLGLQRWTPQMLADSVAKYRPGVSLADHACAVILRDSVGFADAASILFTTGDTAWRILVVVEPSMRDRVRHREYRADEGIVSEWSAMFTIMHEHQEAMHYLQDPRVLFEGADSVWGKAVPEEARQFRAALRMHNSRRDWELARTAILHDQSVANRAAAALVLSNFPERDSTFYLLAEGLRAVDAGAAAAEMVVVSLAKHAPRRVDWAPAREALAALLGGTNLFAYTDVLDVLVATDIDPTLGQDLAGRNPHLLLDHLTARNPMTPPPAHRFLLHISGRDFGFRRHDAAEFLAGRTR